MSRRNTLLGIGSSVVVTSVAGMGQAASVSKEAVAQLAKTKITFSPPLGPPNPVSKHVGRQIVLGGPSLPHLAHWL